MQNSSLHLKALPQSTGSYFHPAEPTVELMGLNPKAWDFNVTALLHKYLRMQMGRIAADMATPNPYLKLNWEIAELRGKARPYSTDLNAAFELIAEMGNNDDCFVALPDSVVMLHMGDSDTPCVCLYHVGDEQREQYAMEPALAVCLAYLDFKKSVLRGDTSNFKTPWPVDPDMPF